MGFTGTVSIWAMKDNDYQATNYPGTTAGLQSAIDSLAGGNGIVQLGPGTLSITAALTVTSNCHVRGIGTATVLKRSSSALGVNVFADGGTAVSNVRISNLCFDNDSLVVTDNDIEFTGGASNIRIEGCDWKNLTNRTAHLVSFNTTTGTHSRYISITGNTVVGGTTTDTYNSFVVFCASDVDVSHNHIDGWGAIKVEQSSASSEIMRRINVSQNRFLNVDQTHIFVRTAGSTEIEDVSVSGNVGSLSSSSVLKGLVNIGEQASGSGGTVRNVSVLGNCGRGHQGNFIVLGSSTAGNVQNATVTGNSFDGRYDGSSSISATSESAGINCQVGCANVSISGNTIRYTGRSGIRFAGNRISVSGNLVEYASQNSLGAPTPVRESGIYVYYPTNSAIISGNVVYNSHNSTLAGSFDTGGITLDKDGALSSVLIYGNTILEDRTGSEGMKYGIKVGVSGATTNPSDVRLWNNSVTGAPTKPYITYGTGTRLWGTITGRGTDITSGATISIPQDGDTFHVTGATNITNGITVNQWDNGRTVKLIFDSTPTVTDTGTSKLNGDFVATADDVLTLTCDGTNWYEVARSTN